MGVDVMTKDMKEMNPRGLLSRPVILEELEKGNIVISPFEKENLGTNSYDIRLGKYYYRERFSSGLPSFHGYVEPRFLYNMYDPDHVEMLYELHEAIRAGDVLHNWFEQKDLEGISKEDLVILIRPGESILGHTEEFIGSNCNHITADMAARSSTGRNALGVCRCAGVGDIGYFNRWTMEITNYFQYHMVPLVVGRRIGQMKFFETVPLDDEDTNYRVEGKYHTTDGLEETVCAWKPQQMLPRAYLDREVQM